MRKGANSIRGSSSCSLALHTSGPMYSILSYIVPMIDQTAPLLLTIYPEVADLMVLIALADNPGIIKPDGEDMAGCPVYQKGGTGLVQDQRGGDQIIEARIAGNLTVFQDYIIFQGIIHHIRGSESAGSRRGRSAYSFPVCRIRSAPRYNV